MFRHLDQGLLPPNPVGAPALSRYPSSPCTVAQLLLLSVLRSRPPWLWALAFHPPWRLASVSLELALILFH